jgi:prepilin-type N-terminal cleavage/methylation domain-containing protein
MATSRPSPPPCKPTAFTLVELMVVLVIIGLLASLALAGLAVARQRAKQDKTTSTIRKINELIIPYYTDLVRRRVPLTTVLTSSTAMALERLRRIRTITLAEMPDHWRDVATSGVSGTFYSGATVPPYAWNSVTRAYGAYHQQLLSSGTGHIAEYPSSECLYMITAFGVGQPDAMEHFRADEIGDRDNDGAPEFHDAWGQPIMFVRWPIAFASPLQALDASLQPDPFDPLHVSSNVAYPIPTVPQRDYAVIPLIVSAGADSAYGISTGTNVWTNLLPALSTIRLETGTTAPGSEAPEAVDNLTNHGLSIR